MTKNPLFSGKSRRVLLVSLSLFAAVSQLPTRAADFPQRPIKVVLGFAPGGGTDLTMRELARQLESRLGQPVVVDNKPSAGSIVAMQTVASAPPDGYTLVLGSPAGFSVTPSLFKKLSFNASQFVLVAPVSTAANVLVAQPDFPANTLSDLAPLAKRRGAAITYGSFGIGTTAHLGMEMFASRAGLQATHVPYKGDSASILALKSRDIDVAVVTMLSAQPRIKSGELKGLGVYQVKPDRNFPSLQTTAQASANDVDLPFWLALFAPPQTPKAVTDKLEAAVRAVVTSAAYQTFLSNNGSEPLLSSNADFMAMLNAQTAQLATVIRDLKIAPEQ